MLDIHAEKGIMLFFPVRGGQEVYSIKGRG